MAKGQSGIQEAEVRRGKGKEMGKRKRAILWVAPECFLSFISASKMQEGRPRQFRVKEHPLPDDCRCVDAGYDVSGGRLMLILESEEFAEVKFGGLLPWCPPPVYEVIYEDEDAVRATMEAKIEALTRVFRAAVALFDDEAVHGHINLVQERRAKEALQEAILAAGVVTGDLREHFVKKVEGGEG